MQRGCRAGELDRCRAKWPFAASAEGVAPVDRAGMCGCGIWSGIPLSITARNGWAAAPALLAPSWLATATCLHSLPTRAKCQHRVVSGTIERGQRCSFPPRATLSALRLRLAVQHPAQVPFLPGTHELMSKQMSWECAGWAAPHAVPSRGEAAGSLDVSSWATTML